MTCLTDKGRDNDDDIFWGVGKMEHPIRKSFWPKRGVNIIFTQFNAKTFIIGTYFPNTSSSLSQPLSSAMIKVNSLGIVTVL